MHPLFRLAYIKVLFQQNNAPAHFTTVVAIKLTQLGFQLVRYPYYSDMVPSDYYLFPNTKKLMSFSAGLDQCYSEGL